MDLSLSNLRRLSYRTPSGGTTATSSQLPTILDAFIPGYTFFCKLVRDDFGFDVSNTVFAFFFLFASATALRYLVNSVGWLSHYFTAAVTVDSNDFICDCILAWAAEHPTLRQARSLHVHSVIESLSVDVDSPLAERSLKRDEDWDSKAAKALPHYDIYKGAHWFWHKGHYFKLAREDQQVPGATVQNQQKLTLTVLGRSTQPIKDLIIEARDRGISKQVRKLAH